MRLLCAFRNRILAPSLIFHVQPESVHVCLPHAACGVWPSHHEARGQNLCICEACPASNSVLHAHVADPEVRDSCRTSVSRNVSYAYL
jgi:hypothetical protein